MTHHIRNIFVLAAGSLILLAATTLPVNAAPQSRTNNGKVAFDIELPSLPKSATQFDSDRNQSRPIGGDWWRTYPWSNYNAWRNPYWYPPYNPNYPLPPNPAYPYNPLPSIQPYPMPLPPWGNGIGSPR
jgi:hypothetical protein